MSIVNSVYSGPTIVYPHDALVVVTDPVSVEALDGVEFTMTAAFSGGVEPILFQWQELLVGGSWTNISGQTTTTLTHTATIARELAEYRCNAEGQHNQPVWTATATLSGTLPPPPEPGYTYAMPMNASLWDVVDGATGGDIVSDNYHIETNGNFGAGGASNQPIVVSPGVPYIFSSTRVSPSHSQFHWQYQVGSAPGLGDILDVVKSPPAAGVVSYEFTPTVSPVYLTIRFNQSDGFDFGAMHWGTVSALLA